MPAHNASAPQETEAFKYIIFSDVAVSSTNHNLRRCFWFWKAAVCNVKMVNVEVRILNIHLVFSLSFRK